MVQLGPFKTLHSTVQLNENTHFNTIVESTWHRNRHLSSLAKGRRHMGCNRLAASVPDIWST